MSKVLLYAGVQAKLASMASRFLTKSDYETLMSKKSVPEITAYLKGSKMYANILKDAKPEELHRRDLEMRLKVDLVEDVKRIFAFFVTLNRHFAYYIMRMYEVENLKLALRNALVEKEYKKNLEELNGKFYDLGKKAIIDPIEVASCSSRDEILTSLEDTPYYEVVRNAFASYERKTANLIQSIENGLDRWLFFGFLRAAKSLDYDDYLVIKSIIGEKIDLINMEWIIRAKAFYSLGSEELYNSLIPMGFRLSSTYLHTLCDAKDLESLLNIASEGPYDELIRSVSEKTTNVVPEMLTLSMKRYLYESSKEAISTYGGFSIASFFHYLFLKEYEIMDVITIIEGVRYNLEKSEIKNYLITWI
ncbi:V-type ATPase subunit [Mesoaciditoga lauensis]|uniref:V-type ATPase subunit n=1 Tax=Mesoaciditoga lauensis TaxID=1495039 RepID=UPI00055D2F34|nr:V-type ATPase subunit [Mesoaciditoga lauensis]